MLRYYHIELNICFKLLEVQLEEGDSISFTGDSFLVLQINDGEKGVMEETSQTDSYRSFNGSASIEFLVQFQISSNGYVLVPISFKISSDKDWISRLMGQCKTYFSGLKTAFYTSNPSPTWQTGIPMTWPLTMLKYWTKMKLSNQIIVPKGLNLGTLWYQVSIKSNRIEFLNIAIKNQFWSFHYSYFTYLQFKMTNF